MPDSSADNLREPSPAGETVPDETKLARRTLLFVRTVGFALGMLATALAALVLFISVSFSERQLNTDIRDFVAAEYGRTLSTTNGVRIGLWPWPSLHIGAANLSEANQPETFASWEAASFELDALALLRHHLVIRHARIDGLTLRLARDRKGVWNTSDLKTSQDLDAPFSLALEGLALTHANVIMDDAISGQRLQWRDMELGTDALRAHRAGRVQLISQVVSPKGALEGKVSLSARYRFGETFSTALLSAIRLHYTGDIGLAPTKQSTHIVKAADLTLNIGTLDLQETQQNGHWQLADVQFDGTGQWRDYLLGARLALPTAAWRSSPQEGVYAKTVSLDISLLDPGADAAQTKHVLHLDAQDLAPDSKNTRTAKLAGHWTLQTKTHSAQGKLRGLLQHDALSAQLSLGKIDASLALTHPALNAVNAHATVQGTALWRLAPAANIADTELNLSAKFGNDVLHIASSYAAGNGASVPAISARIDSAGFDVDRLLAAGVSAFQLPTADALQGWSLDGVLQASNIRIGGLLFRTANVPVKVLNGQVTLHQHALTLYGGKLAGSIAFDATKQNLTLYEALREVQLGELTHDAKIPFPLAGLTNATLDVASQGTTLQAMPDKTQGVLRIYAKNALWQGLDIRANMLATHAKQTPTNDAKSLTPLSEISAAFAVDGPTLLMSRLSAHNPTVVLTGSGSIAYTAGQLDLLVNTQAGNDKSVAALKGARQSLRITGPLLRAQVQAQGQALAQTSK